MTKRELIQFWRKSESDLIFTQATALAYTTLVSLVPILAVAFFLFRAFGGLDLAMEKLQPLIQENLAPNFGEKITEYLNSFVKNVSSGAVGFIGIIGFILTSVSTLSTVEKTFNSIWGVKKSREIGTRIMAYWSLLTIGPLFILVSLLISNQAMSWLDGAGSTWAHLTGYVMILLPYLFSWALFTFLYYFIPNAQMYVSEAAKAGFVTSLVFEITKHLYSYYARNTLAKASIYGSLAIFPVFLLWLYVVWLVVLFGAQLCCYFQYKRLHIPYKFSSDSRLNPFLIADVLEELARSQEDRAGGMRHTKLLSDLKISVTDLVPHLDFLIDRGWVMASSGSAFGETVYTLRVNHQQIDMQEILGQLDSHRYQPRCPHGSMIHKEFKKLWKNWEVLDDSHKNHAEVIPAKRSKET